jgi:hypothetical protein
LYQKVGKNMPSEYYGKVCGNCKNLENNLCKILNKEYYPENRCDENWESNGVELKDILREIGFTQEQALEFE